MKDLDVSIEHLQRLLLGECNAKGYWTGHLSSSALSTATAVFALASVDSQKQASPINTGLDWLYRHQNPDGGWGDTTLSQSNLSTTLLVYSALSATTPAPSQVVQACEDYLVQLAGSLRPNDLIEAILKSYGSDQSFSVPILTMCALAGRLGADAWSQIPGLPFELAILPQRLFKWLQLPVVSYALPALIAIGQVGYHHRRPGCPVKRTLRHWARPRSLSVLSCLQPDNGGFLEATPLTAFVVMSLAHSDQRDYIVTRKGTRFLLGSQRKDGSWPIDTNLATWVTTLATQALDHEGIDATHAQSLRYWLLQQQHHQIHPYTQADPGGWAWTDLPGAVPDADDTPGALLALSILDPKAEHCHEGVTQAVQWLLGLQNRDGGMPTFCRGWGKLPFDRSCADLTAHSLAAWSVWHAQLSPNLQARVDRAICRALDFLKRIQRSDGAWIPLWFGNEQVRDKANPLYGTARTLSHLSRVQSDRQVDMQDNTTQALQWLLAAQHKKGGWGGDQGCPASIEETALAVDALASQIGHGKANDKTLEQALERGTQALLNLIGNQETLPASPIGLYFSQLWYHERLYPLVFSLSALRKARGILFKGG